MTAPPPARRFPDLQITPERPCLDTVLRIQMRGLPPGSEVTLRARQGDAHGHPWQSEATFSADADGTIDLAQNAPVHGSYRQVDPMGLVWSMTPAATAAAGPAGVLAPAHLEVAASYGGAQVAAASRDRCEFPTGYAGSR
jgi:hypothetical protein